MTRTIKSIQKLLDQGKSQRDELELQALVAFLKKGSKKTLDRLAKVIKSND